MCMYNTAHRFQANEAFFFFFSNTHGSVANVGETGQLRQHRQKCLRVRQRPGRLPVLDVIHRDASMQARERGGGGGVDANTSTVAVPVPVGGCGGVAFAPVAVAEVLGQKRLRLPSVRATFFFLSSTSWFDVDVYCDLLCRVLLLFCFRLMFVSFDFGLVCGGVWLPLRDQDRPNKKTRCILYTT